MALIMDLANNEIVIRLDVIVSVVTSTAAFRHFMLETQREEAREMASHLWHLVWKVVVDTVLRLCFLGSREAVLEAFTRGTRV